MAVGRPVLLLGPDNSYAGKIIKENKIGWQIDHGDVNGAIDIVHSIIAIPKDELNEMGNRARQLADNIYCRTVLLKHFCDIFDE
jgi:colanic acid biosynthesis glycosyl transferase WcaI